MRKINFQPTGTKCSNQNITALGTGFFRMKFQKMGNDRREERTFLLCAPWTAGS